MSNVLNDILKLLPISMEVEEAKFLLAKALGYGIIVGSSLIKLPQIIKIVNAKSGSGINWLAQSLELCAYTFTCSYAFANGYPFSSYGESTFLALETFIICLVILIYGGKKMGSIVFSAAYLSSLFTLATGKVPINVLWYFQSMNVPLGVGGKMIQAISNLKNGHTGHCSAITSTCLFLGCIARIFTSIQETKDQLMIFSFCTAAIANLALVSQIIYYWDSTNKFLAKEAKKKKK